MYLPFERAAEGFTHAAPTDFTEDSFLLPYLLVLWVCAHEKRSWMKKSKQYHPVSAAIMQTGHTTVSPKGSCKDGGITSHVRQGMTPDFQICHPYCSCSEAGSTHQLLGAEGNGSRGHRVISYRTLQQFITLLTSIFNRSASSFVVFSRTSASEEHQSALLSKAAQIQAEQLSSKSEPKTTNCFDWSLHSLLTQG